MHTINSFLPLLRAGTLKKVITLSSGGGDLDFTLKSGFASHVAYCVSKAALNMVNAKYAAEYAEQGFIFLALSPGFVSTMEEQCKILVPVTSPLRTCARNGRKLTYGIYFLNSVRGTA